MKAIHRRGFSLIEVTIALGVCAFVLMAILGLFSIGIKDSRDSVNQFHAADLAAEIIALRSAAPTTPETTGTLAIPAGKLTQAYANAYSTERSYVGFDGKLTTSTKAAYSVVCWSGTTAATGPRMAQVYLMLSWPAMASLTTAEGKYETITYLPIP